MEEIVGSEAIRREVLEEARKTAARLLAEADEASAQAMESAESRARAAVEEIARTGEARTERFRMETMARLPLERRRMRTVFVDARLREAMAAFLTGLGEEDVAALAQAMLSRGAPYLEGKKLAIERKGLSEAAARACAAAALPGSASTTFVLAEGQGGRGLEAVAVDGSVRLRATMDLVAEALLDQKRGELARALCPEAMESQG